MCVGPTACLCGLDPADVLVCGMANGLFPGGEYFDLTTITPEKQAKRHDLLRRTFYLLACSARSTQAFSRFTHVDMQTAYRLKLKIDRIGLKNGEQVATIGESEMLALAR